MKGKVLIRSFKYGDEPQIQRLVNEATMSTVWPVFATSVSDATIFSCVLILSAILFVVVGWPLLYSLMVFPVILTLFFIGVYVGHKIKAMMTHKDLNRITEEYQSDPRCGFWVAEMIDEPRGFDPLEIVKDDDLIDINAISGTIIGSVGVSIKEDSREPPKSVAWLRRMVVARAYQHFGVGAALTDVVLEHCAKANFRACELLTTEHHEAARGLYVSKGFELIESTQLSYAGGLVSFKLHRMRLPCILTRANLNA